MNKSQLIEAVAQNSGLKKSQAEAAVKAFTEAVTEALKAGDKVQLVGGGAFAVKAKAAGTARNPRTGETIEVPAKKVPAFAAGKALKDAIQ